MLLAKELKLVMVRDLEAGRLILNPLAPEGPVYGITCKWADSQGYVAFKQKDGKKIVELLAGPTEHVFDFGSEWEISVSDGKKILGGAEVSDHPSGLVVTSDGSYIKFVRYFHDSYMFGYIPLLNPSQMMDSQTFEAPDPMVTLRNLRIRVPSNVVNEGEFFDPWID